MSLCKNSTKTITFSCGCSKAIQGMKCFTCMAASASCSIPPLLHFIKTLHTHKTPQQHSLLIRHHLPLLSSTKLKPCCTTCKIFDNGENPPCFSTIQTFNCSWRWVSEGNREGASRSSGSYLQRKLCSSHASISVRNRSLFDFFLSNLHLH